MRAPASSVVLVVALILISACGANVPTRASTARGTSATPTTTPTTPPDDYTRGDPLAMPELYRWLGPYTPSETYHLVLVRGVRPKAALRMMGGVKRRLDGMEPADASGWVYDHMDRHYNSPTVVQVARRGRATFVYVPENFIRDESIQRMSRHGKAVAFTNTVEYDTYLTVFKRGRQIRSFDAGFRPPREGALPQEAGLDWGARHQNIWATAWAFIERVTLTHISKAWFRSTHPTYVVKSHFP